MTTDMDPDSGGALAPRVSGLSPKTRREPGQAIALAAVLMVAMVGMLAFVVDAGMFLMAHQELQKAADAAAEAGVVVLADSPANATTQSNALTTAQQVAQANFGLANGICRPDSQPAFVPGTPAFGTYALNSGGAIYTITVTVRCDAGYTFGRILELVNIPISATGTSAVGSLKETECPAPFAVEARSYLNPVTGVLEPPSASNNFGWGAGQFVTRAIRPASSSTADAILLCLNGDSNCGGGNSSQPNTIAGWIARNPCVPLSTGSSNLKTRNSAAQVTGPIKDGLTDRFRQGFSTTPPSVPYVQGNRVNCPDATPFTPVNSSVPNPQNAPSLSPWAPNIPVVNGITNPADPNYFRTQRISNCLMALPALDPLTIPNLDQGAGGSVTVKGFALFFISYYDGGSGSGTMGGYFVRPAVTGALGAYQSDGQPIYRPVR